MLQRIKNLFLLAGQFRIAPRTGAMPNCTIRLLQEGDLDACEAIYRLNEPAHFPAGFFPRFSDWLRNGRALILVAEQDGVVRALGGINAQHGDGRYIASLSFGMVHPAAQRQGLGTALLLARLALLASTDDDCIVVLNTVGGSETFYGRFGLSFARAVQVTPDYVQKHYRVRVSPKDVARCRAALGSVLEPLTLGDIRLPPLSGLPAPVEEAER